MNDETLAFDGLRWRLTAETVDEVGPGDSGVWLISTNGTTHVWDLERRRFCRLPGAGTRAAPMAFDGVVLRWSRVQVYPRVGERLVVWFDDPLAPGPAAVEHFRASSGIRTIRRLEPSSD